MQFYHFIVHLTSKITPFLKNHTKFRTSNFETGNMHCLQAIEHGKREYYEILVKIQICFKTNDYNCICLNFTNTTNRYKISSNIRETLIYFFVRRIIATRDSKLVIIYEGVLWIYGTTKCSLGMRSPTVCFNMVRNILKLYASKIFLEFAI